MNHIGAEQATTIRTAARELAELGNLARTSSPREIFYDLSEALGDLCDPIRTLLSEFIETGEDNADEVFDVEALSRLASSLRYWAENI
jgi:hypothetical protein